MVNVTDKFIDYLLEKIGNANQTQLKHQAKRCVLDYLGVIFAGQKLLGDKGARLVRQFPDVEDGSSVIGFSMKKSPDSSAFLNGFISHVAELDDGVNSGIVHPGTPILSAMFALAQVHDVSGEDFIKGIIAGYEATIRLANAVQPAHKKKGYHATATCGAAGAAIALAIMLKQPRYIIKNAFSASLISAGGSLKALENESELKPFNVGNAAKAGLTAYLTAEAGFNGPNDALGGTIGFLEMKSGTYDLEKLMPSTTSFAINSVYIKPYAACRYCHPAIEAAIKIAHRQSLTNDDIKTIKVTTYDLAVKNHDHTHVNSMSSAKMSIPFSVATAIKHGKGGILEFSEYCVDDLSIQALTKKVAVFADEQYSQSFPEKSIAELNITLFDDSQLSELVENPKGEPENPLSDIELEQKFTELVSFSGLQLGERKEIIQNVWSLEIALQKIFTII